MSQERDRRLERTREVLAAKDEEANSKAGEETPERRSHADDEDVPAESTARGKNAADK